MEKDRSSKIISIMALLIAVLGLTIGFASFSNQLDISTDANVTTDPNEFSVDFSSSSTEISTLLTSSNITLSNNATGNTNKVVIDNSSNSNPKISNLTANFTAPGQSVTYTFYAVNTGLYDAFLKSIDAEPVSDNNYVVCTATDSSEADATLIKNACNTITVAINVSQEKPITLSTSGKSGDNQSITNHKLSYTNNQIGDADKITVTITYGSDAQRVDGDFDVKFGTISLIYSSVD
jgi:hypothetical protein